MDDLTGFCLGCHRTMDEISQWFDMSQAERDNVSAELAKREAENLDFD
jgi:predicted Fe-S protein YdhL (DUF1289 family)